MSRDCRHCRCQAVADVGKGYAIKAGQDQTTAQLNRQALRAGDETGKIPLPGLDMPEHSKLAGLHRQEFRLQPHLAPGFQARPTAPDLPLHAPVLVRRAPGDRERPSQVLAANVDVVFIVTSVNAEFNVRRLERYITVAWESGARPVVLLSKADLAEDLDDLRLQAEIAAPGVEAIAVSALTGEGIEAVRSHLGEGRTVVFTGSSGVGKSSIVNALAGAPLLDTGGIREDDARGRHTTTRRQLVRLADGLLIDTPGLRELGVLDGEGLSSAFEDVEALAAQCRFTDCRHRSEPGCAVRAAIVDGTLRADRLAAYEKLEREAHRSVLASDALARRAERKKWTAISKSVDVHMKFKYGAER